MAIQLDHMILAVNDRKQSIEFYVDILGLKYEGDREPFSVLRVTPDFTLQIAEIVRRVREAKLEYGDNFHSVGNMRGPGDETSESIATIAGGARGPGKNLYF